MKISSRKLIKKLAVGGSTPDPLAGVGIQYVASAPELPNINAAMYFDQARRQSDDALQEERKKLLPDQKAIFELISKAPGTSGHKAIVSSEVADAIKHYRDRVSENPDWVFSQEGRDALYNIENLTSPARFQQMAEKQRQIQMAYDNAFKNGTLNQYHIRDGMISVLDSRTGQRVDVPMSQFELDQKSVAPKFKALRVGEAYSLADQHQDFDMSAHQIFGDMMTAQQAREELMSYFNDLGKSITSDQFGVTTTGSNAYQRAQAKEQAIIGLSSKAKDALRSDFIEKTGRYSEEDFKQYLSQLIDTESEKRKLLSFDVNASALSNLNKSGQEEEKDKGVVMPAEVATNPDYVIRLNTRPWYLGGKKEEGSLYRFSTSNIETDKNQKPLTVNGRVYLYGDLGPLDYNTSDEVGGGAIQMNTTFGNAVHVENSVFAVKTGLVRKWNAEKRVYEDKMTKTNGDPIIRYYDSTDGIRRFAQLQTGYTDSGRRYYYFEDRDGNQVVVEFRGFKVYNVYNGKIGDSGETEKKATVLIPVNRDESIQLFGVNRSGIYHNEEHVVRIGGSIRVSPEAEKTLQEVMSNPKISMNKKVELQNLYRMVRENPGDQEIIQAFNAIINAYMDQITDADLLNNATRPKTEFTPTSASDNRN